MPLPSSLSLTIPYNLSKNYNKKKRVTHGESSTQSKKAKLVDPELSLPEESDMDDKIRELLNKDKNLNESDDDSTLKYNNEDII